MRRPRPPPPPSMHCRGPAAVVLVQECVAQGRAQCVSFARPARSRRTAACPYRVRPCRPRGGVAFPSRPLAGAGGGNPSHSCWPCAVCSRRVVYSVATSLQSRIPLDTFIYHPTHARTFTHTLCSPRPAHPLLVSPCTPLSIPCYVTSALPPSAVTMCGGGACGGCCPPPVCITVHCAPCPPAAECKPPPWPPCKDNMLCKKPDPPKKPPAKPEPAPVMAACYPMMCAVPMPMPVMMPPMCAPMMMAGGGAAPKCGGGPGCTCK